MKYQPYLLFSIVCIFLFYFCSNESQSRNDTVLDVIEDITSIDTYPNKCVRKSDCESGMYCDRDKNECIEGECFDNTDCQKGFLCDSARHYCYFVGCSKNEDCKDGICKKRTGECVGCLIDADCKSGNCNSAIGICLYNNCTDDKLEPNDSFSQAYQLNAGTRKLTLCPKDDDYFKVSLSYKDKLSVKLRTSSVKTVTIYLYYEKDLNNPISFTNIINSGELTLPSAPETGAYFIKVVSTDSTVNYEIEIDRISSVSSCINDIFEENDSESSARNITTGIYKELVLCPDERDFYKINLNKGDNLEITIIGEGINATFYSTTENLKNINIGTKSLINIENSNTYFLLIDSDENKTHLYSIEIKINSSMQCNDDMFEENDSPGAAMEIPLNKTTNLNLCPYDDDWFLIKSYGRPTKITLESEINLPFEVYSLNNTTEPILYSDELNSKTQIAEFENLPDLLLIKVPSSSNSLSYTLRVDSQTDICVDDPFEPNNSRSGAKIIKEGEYNSLMLCLSDEDYYAIQLNRGDNINIDVKFDNSKADIDIILFDPLFRESAYSISSSGVENISYTADSSGDYVLNVFAWDNGSSPYQMNIKINRPQLCADDRFEENDSIKTATKLNSDEIYGLKICPTDYDYYSIILNQGDRLSTGVFYTEKDGKLYSSLLSSDGKTVLATGENQSGDIVLNITATYSGEYILLVRGVDNDTTNNYDILIDIQRNNTCADDLYEENDSFQYAPAIPYGEISQLILCPQEIDVYKVYLNSNDTILSEISVSNSDTADYSITLYDPSGNIMDSAGGRDKNKSVISEITYSGYYYIYIKNNSSSIYNYRLSIQVDGSGGRSGEETITIYPFDIIDKDHPALYELNFARTPKNAVVENLVLSLIIEHKSLSDLIIQAQYGNTSEVTIWDGYGGTTDKGFDDDKEDDSDIELYNRNIANAKGEGANNSLLLMIDDISNIYGTVFVIEGRLFWKIK